MMSGAVWVRDRLRSAGWEVKVAHARKVRDVAPLACKTDKVDARVLAELCRRELVLEVWVPSIEDRALRELLRRRVYLVKLRTSARNRVFGLLTQSGLRVPLKRLREPTRSRSWASAASPRPGEPLSLSSPFASSSRFDSSEVTRWRRGRSALLLRAVIAMLLSLAWY